MEHIKAFEVAQRACSPCGHQLDRSPTDFLGGAGSNFCSKRFRHELRPEAYTKGRAQACKPRGHECKLAPKKRIGLLFIDPDRSAEHDEEISAFDLRAINLTHADILIARLDPALLEDRCERAEILELDVTKDETSFHRVLCLPGSRRRDARRLS